MGALQGKRIAQAPLLRSSQFLSDNLRTMPKIILGSKELTPFTALIKICTLFTNIGHLKWERVCADVLKQRKHPGICLKKVGLREEVQGREGLVAQVEQ